MRACRVKPIFGCLTVIHVFCFILWLFTNTALAEKLTNKPIEKVTLQLTWYHQFQFAGYYAAKIKGYYREEGLDVEIKERNPNLLPVDAVLSGKADFGNANSDLVLLRMQGKPVVVLANIMQHSPWCLLARADSGITVPEDLIGKTVSMEESYRDVEIQAMFKYENISTEKINIIKSMPGVKNLINGTVDARLSYICDEPCDLRTQGYEPRVIRPVNYGIDFYGDNLFTSERQIHENPHRVAAFRRASIRGWQYAMDYPEEIIDYILSTYYASPTQIRVPLSREHLLYEAAMLAENLMHPKLIEIGHINPQRWQRIADIYADMGMAEPIDSLKGFIYDPNPKFNYKWIYWTIGIIVVICLIIGIYATFLFSFNKRLNLEIQERTAELVKANEELIKMQKLESIGVLAGGIAHDFNNYLQKIMSNIETAKSYADSNDKSYAVLSDSERTVLQAKDLTQQLLTFSKGGEPIKEEISVSKLIKDSANFALSGTNTKCEFNIPDFHCLVEVDKGQMNQIFSNLFINANEAMPEGGLVEVWVESINNLIKESLPLQERRYIKITIKDHGIGIPQDKLQKIFDPYFTTKHEGSGLGLAITYSVVKKHGGYITVESEMEVGTTFYIYIPLSEKEISSEPVLDEAESSRPVLAEGKGEDVTSLAGKKILFMDDDAIIKLAVVNQLKSLQYEVEDAIDGTEVLELYRKAFESGKPFDAVVMDLTIPGGMGGKEAIKELHKIDIDTKAIVASGYSNDPVMTNFGKYGFKGMVIKPYRIRELEKVLQKVIMGKEEP